MDYVPNVDVANIVNPLKTEQGVEFKRDVVSEKNQIYIPNAKKLELSNNKHRAFKISTSNQ